MRSKYSHLNPTSYETHMLVYEEIEKGSKVLDVGCATGYFAEKLKEKRCKVWGVEIGKEAGRVARKYCEKVIIGDVEKMRELPFEKNFFDYILLLDILEHLKEPLSVLRMVKPYLKSSNSSTQGESLLISPPWGSLFGHPRGVLRLYENSHCS